MKYDFYEDKLNPNSWQAAGENIGDILGTALQGFADWIGLGNLVGRWVSKSGKFDRSKAISAINAQIAKLQATNDRRVSDLQSQLDKLSASGFNLSGIAAEKFGSYRTKLQKELNQEKISRDEDNVNFTKLNADISKAEDESTRLAPSSSRISKDILTRAKNILKIN